MSKAIPNDLRNLRACLLCSLVKSYDQFLEDGCDNCDEVLPMRGQREAVLDYTSANFDGFIAMMSPPQSWVAKWQRIDKFTPGMYAVSVSGTMPKEAVRELKGHGINYKPRDSTQGPGR
ncbi:putative Transcription elongation factor SPT4 [Hypsibius exemplaris]|uniref:Transcription elongation factor SPT4 n=1 Tax=Hypsibius exemplaris TaxID=2072580 RepID=A0A1W0X8H8_HYPEX|nr:putative Transcription elongation factor SPT4 [Hypsibius exemplaris]